jgi:hypothetical protein
MTVHCAFWLARRTGGVKQPGEVVLAASLVIVGSIAVCNESLVGFRPGRRSANAYEGFYVFQIRTDRLKSRGEIVRKNYDLASRIPKYVRRFFRVQASVHWNGHRAAFESGKHRFEKLGTVSLKDRDSIALPYPGPPELGSKLVGPTIEITIRPPKISIDDGDVIGRRLRRIGQDGSDVHLCTP